MAYTSHKMDSSTDRNIKPLLVFKCKHFDTIIDATSPQHRRPREDKHPTRHPACAGRVSEKTHDDSELVHPFSMLRRALGLNVILVVRWSPGTLDKDIRHLIPVNLSLHPMQVHRLLPRHVSTDNLQSPTHHPSGLWYHLSHSAHPTGPPSLARCIAAFFEDARHLTRPTIASGILRRHAFRDEHVLRKGVERKRRASREHSLRSGHKIPRRHWPSVPPIPLVLTQHP
mmetsp:Transcript_118080/g.270882  ORF Transcript_118080/g.270882 Transcript_118080/m.270882 type:complete len:228 (-) Transcript_118080:62-745(-)